MSGRTLVPSLAHTAFRLQDCYPLRSAFPGRFGYAMWASFGWSTTPDPKIRFGLFPVRSPLLRESMFLSLPPGTKMFQFSGFPSLHLCLSSVQDDRTLLRPGFPIRTPADQRLFAPPRSLSQLIASFFGFQCQGIRLMLFFT